MTAVLPDLNMNDFGGNLFAALKELGLQGEDVPRDWSLLSRYACRAAKVSFDYLDELGSFNMRFRIILDRIYEDSVVWVNIVDAQQHIYRTITARDNDGFYQLATHAAHLDERLAWEHAVGDREVWLEAARRFFAAYEQA